MYLKFWGVLVVVLYIVGGSLQSERKKHNNKNHESKRHKGKSSVQKHNNDRGYSPDDGTTFVDDNTLGPATTITPPANTQPSGNTNRGPVLFPGPQQDPPTTPIVFLYNTTAPPVDNHIDARKKFGTLKKSARSKTQNKHGSANKKAAHGKTE